MLLLAMFTRVLALFYLQATASRLRRVVFSILLLWAIVDGCLTFRDWWQINHVPLAVCVLGFLGSVVFSVWFIGVIAMSWDWLARRLQSCRFKGTLKKLSVTDASATEGEAHHVTAAAGIAAPTIPASRWAIGRTATQTVCDREVALYGRLKFVPKDQSAQMLERGRYHSENGFKNIGDWEERMVKEFGESVVEFLPDVWNEIKRDRNPTELSSSNRNPNRALDLLTSSYSHHPCVAHLVCVLSDLAKGLCTDAEGTTATMLAAFEVEIAPARRRLLVECVLDLELVSSFGEVMDYTRDNALASCYVDAILFQATGKESNGCPSDGQYRNEGTHTCRGIAKYRKAKEYFKVADPIAWLFGKEFGAIVFDNARDIAYVAGVQPLTALIRAHGVWRTRYALTGEVPTTDEQNKVIAFVEKTQEARNQLLENLSKSSAVE